MKVMFTPLDSNNARDALDVACATVELDSTEAELIRLGENAVFRLTSVPVIARVSRDETLFTETNRQVQVSRWLNNNDVPAVKALDIPQPVRSIGRLVTFWESASDKVEYGTTVELAHLLRRLHTLDVPEDIGLPHLVPLERAQVRIANLTALPADDRTFLQTRCQQLTGAYNSLSFSLPPTPIHGDANVGNLFRDRNGRAILGDLDSFAIGPREWDLILTAIYYDRFGWHTDHEYRSFVEIYGHDIIKSPEYETLRDIRELLMVTWLAQNARSDTKIAAELSKRMSALHSGASRKDWQPY